MIEIKADKRDSGFSLTEMVVSLAIAAVLMALSIPMVSGSMRSWQLAADARNIANTLASARLSASAQMTHYRLSFNLGGNTWQLEKYNRGTSTFDVQGSTNELSTGLANSDIAFKSASSAALSGFPTNSSTVITFNSRGIPIDGAGVPTPANVIYLSGGQTDYAVTVSLTGKVQLWKYQSNQWVSQ
jgi:prepilin-type N-terminal cleavage/methylation domain-containing protein